MMRHLLIIVSLSVTVACSGGDSDDDTSSCPEGLTCDAGTGGAPGGSGGTVTTGGTGSDAAGTPGSGGASGGAGADTGGAQANTGGDGSGGAAPELPDRCTVIDGGTAAALVADGASLVDVRTPEEYAAGFVAGAINIPLDELSARLDELPTDVPIIVYCRSGSRSAQAATILCDAGLYVLDVGAMSNYPS